MSTTRIAFIADIHHGEDVMTKRSSQALALLSEFAAFVDAQRPDIVIDLGDRIFDRDRETDLVLEREVADALGAIAVPVYHLNGNHDRDFLTVADNEAILGKSLGHEVVDLGAWQAVIWRADTHIHRLPTGATFDLGEGDLDWLAATLEGATKPTVIASHVPLYGQSQRSNYYFDQNSGISTYPQLDAIQEVLRQTSVPITCISGHVHWNSVTFVDGIAHVTLQSLTETFTTAPDAAEAWGMLELADRVEWTAHGRQHFRFGIDASALAQRWPRPHPPFRPRVTAAA